MMPARLFAPRYWATWLALGVMRLVVALPYGAILAVGRGLGRVGRRLLARHVRIARRNIELCLPELGPAEREALIDRHFESLGIGLFEAGLTWWAKDAKINALAELQGREHLEAVLARGRGAILIAAHFTTLQISARILNNHVPISVLYRPNENELLDYVSRRNYGRHARQAIRRGDVRAMVAALRRNEVIWYLADQAYRKKGAAMVPFFGHPAATLVFTPRLVEMTGAAVLYYSTERLPGTRGWRAVIHRPFAHWPSGDPAIDTRDYHAAIEAQVRRVPEQYWWIHRRFKGLTADYPDYYAPR
jgi:Kdo2-lipid IVA lauroyltransferase/acyltransferase